MKNVESKFTFSLDLSLSLSLSLSVLDGVECSIVKRLGMDFLALSACRMIDTSRDKAAECQYWYTMGSDIVSRVKHHSPDVPRPPDKGGKFDDLLGSMTTPVPVLCRDCSTYEFPL